MQAALGGSATQAALGGSATQAALGGSATQAALGGSATQAALSGSATQAALGGSPTQAAPQQASMPGISSSSGAFDAAMKHLSKHRHRHEAARETLSLVKSLTASGSLRRTSASGLGLPAPSKTLAIGHTVPKVAEPKDATPTAAKPTAAKPTAAKPTAAKPTAAKPTAAKLKAAKPTAAKPKAVKLKAVARKAATTDDKGKPGNSNNDKENFADTNEEADKADGSEDEDDVPLHMLFTDHGPHCMKCGTQEEDNPKKGAMLICDYGLGKDKTCDAGWHMGCVGLKRKPPKRERWFCPEHAKLMDVVNACGAGCNDGAGCENCTLPSDSSMRKRMRTA
jgi:hypothetical protein